MRTSADTRPWLQASGLVLLVVGIVVAAWGWRNADSVAQVSGITTAGLGAVIALPAGRDWSADVWDRLLLWKYPVLAILGVVTAAYGALNGLPWAIAVGALQFVIGTVAYRFRL